MICCNFHYCAANMQQYAAKQKFLTKLLLTIMFLIKNNTSLQNFMKFSLWVKELCSMLQIAKDAAIMLQMQSQLVFGACNLFHHSLQANWVLLHKIQVILCINTEFSYYAAFLANMLQICCIYGKPIIFFLGTPAYHVRHVKIPLSTNFHALFKI